MTTTTLSPVQQIEYLHQRLEKAREIVADGKVYPVLNQDGHYVVQASDGQGFYAVNAECCCQDSQHRTEVHHGWCKHRLAVELYLAAQTTTETEQPQAGKKSKKNLVSSWPEEREQLEQEAKAEEDSSPHDKELEAKVNDLYR